MTADQFLNVLSKYRADVLLLAAGVCLLTALLKKTVLRNCPNKVYVFLPFLLGLVIYAAYRMAATASAAPLTADIGATVEGGFGCGSLATLYYVVYEQFFKKGKTAFSLSPVLGGIVPEERCEEAADALMSGGKQCPAEELPGFVEETIVRYADDLSEAELAAAVRAISALLSALRP